MITHVLRPCSHPLTSSHPHPQTTPARTQERFIEWVNTHEDVQWVRMIDMADEFRARVAPPSGAIMPRGVAPPATTVDA